MSDFVMVFPVRTDIRFGFWQASLAFAALKNREAIGKVLIVFDEPRASTARAKL